MRGVLERCGVLILKAVLIEAESYVPIRTNRYQSVEIMLRQELEVRLTWPCHLRPVCVGVQWSSSAVIRSAIAVIVWDVYDKSTLAKQFTLNASRPIGPNVASVPL